jgi:hypothetical protein
MSQSAPTRRPSAHGRLAAVVGAYQHRRLLERRVVVDEPAEILQAQVFEHDDR